VYVIKGWINHHSASFLGRPFLGKKVGHDVVVGTKSCKLSFLLFMFFLPWKELGNKVFLKKGLCWELDACRKIS
jgi:hypothetical protein